MARKREHELEFDNKGHVIIRRSLYKNKPVLAEKPAFLDLNENWNIRVVLCL